MNKNLLEKVISELENENRRLSNDLSALRLTDFYLYPENYINIAGNATRRSEKITEQLRNIVPFLDTKSRLHLNFEKQSAKNMKIEIQHTEKSITILIPSLTPTRTFSFKSDFILGPLYYTLNQYASENQLPKHQQSVVMFTHTYDARLSRRRVRDYDNLEYKNVLDIVSLFTLPDDGGCHCEVHQRTEFSTRDATRIDVISTLDFADWYSKLLEK